jgi:feruloyl-CoA synthase
VLASAPVRLRMQAIINQLAREATGSASRIARALLLAEPPSIDKGELTDKGSINQRAVLKHRDALVQALHDDTAPNIIKPQV